MICTLGDRAPHFKGAGHYVADYATIIGSVRLIKSDLRARA